VSLRLLSRSEIVDGPQERPSITAVVVGGGLTGGCLAALTDRWRVDVIDFDVAEPGQQIVPALSRAGRAKAVLAREYRRSRFPWTQSELAVVGEAEAVGDGYWRWKAEAGAIVLAMTDSVPTQMHLAAVAKRHGLPYIATGLGPDAAEVFVSPTADAACYGCLGREPDEDAAGCFVTGVDAAPANAAEPPATNSTLALAALASARAVGEATAIALGRREAAELIHLPELGEPFRSPVAPSDSCAVCARERDREPREVAPVECSWSDGFAEIAAAAGAPSDCRVLLPGRSCRSLVCPDCAAVHEPGHPLVLARTVVCGACGGRNLVAVEPAEPGETVPLDDLAAVTPRSAGWPWWPVIDLIVGGRTLSVELAGDRPDGEVVELRPMTVEGRSDAH